MTRVKRGTIKLKKRKRLVKQTKGFRWGRKSKAKAAREALFHAWTYQYRDRKNKKREFRKLWQIRLNAAVREHGLSYSVFAHLLKTNKIELDRKILADLAANNKDTFKAIVETVKKK